MSNYSTSYSFLQVCDGHDGVSAAQFVCEQLLKNIVEDPTFPTDVRTALSNAFLRTDAQLEATWQRQREHVERLEQHRANNSSTSSCTSSSSITSMSSSTASLSSSTGSVGTSELKGDDGQVAANGAAAHAGDGMRGNGEGGDMECGTTAISALLLGR